MPPEEKTGPTTCDNVLPHDTSKARARHKQKHKSLIFTRHESAFRFPSLVSFGFSDEIGYPFLFRFLIQGVLRFFDFLLLHCLSLMQKFMF
ncbi:hypothetical protein NC651_017160 [Populus alba x Populus x berolinensis]|nr:hypothetical protein NC651_017160 [Populus alba x Populus x berolinensis]